MHARKMAQVPARGPGRTCMAREQIVMHCVGAPPANKLNQTLLALAVPRRRCTTNRNNITLSSSVAYPQDSHHCTNATKSSSSVTSSVLASINKIWMYIRMHSFPCSRCQLQTHQSIHHNCGFTNSLAKLQKLVPLDLQQLLARFSTTQLGAHLQRLISRSNSLGDLSCTSLQLGTINTLCMCCA